jgi:hypothetical protein
MQLAAMHTVYPVGLALACWAAGQQERHVIAARVAAAGGCAESGGSSGQVHLQLLLFCE